MKAYRKYAPDTFKKGVDINVQANRINMAVDAFIKSMNLTITWNTKVMAATWPNDTETEFIVKFEGADEDEAVDMMETLFGPNTIEKATNF